MCGRYSVTSPGRVIAEIFGIDEPIELAAHYNLCPGQDVPVVRARHGDDDRTLGLLRWGLVPWFVKQPGPAARLINARAESAATSPAFREALRRRRCILPADGFYEWRASEVRRAPKQPFFIRGADQRPLALAGLWERWQGADGTRIESCTVLTTTPNELLREVHDRMPVILAPQAWSLWLDRDVREVARITPLLAPAPADGLVVTPVTTWVNDPKHDDAQCVSPLALGPVDRGGSVGY